MKSLAAAAIATLTFGAMAEDEGVQLWKDGPYFASYNVGATSDKEYGYFFWWGDTVGYKMKSYTSFNPSSGQYLSVVWESRTGKTMTESPFQSSKCPTAGLTPTQLYNDGYTDADGNLKPEYDAATVILGDPWRMPTKAELQAMFTECNCVWQQSDQTNAYLQVTGKGEFSTKTINIRLVAEANANYMSVSQPNYLWTSHPDATTTTKSSCANMTSSARSFAAKDRYWGMQIRAVRTKPLATKNAITIDTEIQHGSVTADKEKAKKDETVTLTVTPDAGYATSKLKYFKTDDPSEEVEISGDSFTMPDYAVTVTATFEAQDQTITLAPFEHGSVETDPAGSARTDATVTINPSPELGYAVGALKVTKTDDPSTEVPVSDNQFTMPPYGVTVAVTFVAQSQTITIAGTEHGMVETEPAGSAKTDETVTITTTPESGYALKTISVAGTMTKPEVTPVEEGKTYTFVMPYEEVTVTVTFEELTAKVVPVRADNTDIEGVYTNGFKVAESTTEKDTYIVKKGANVTVKFQGEPGYFFKEGDNYLPTKDVVAENVQADIEVPCPEGPVQGTSCGGSVYGFLNDGAMTMVGSGAATSMPFGKYSITSVKIGDGVTSLGAGFFKGCPMIVTVTGGKDLTSVGSEAFYLCMSLETLALDCSKPTGMDAAVKYVTAYVQGQGWKEIPLISYKGSVIMLYGKNDLKDEEWTKIGPAKNYKTMEETGYHFFQTRVKDEEVAK